ncbi:MAG: TonB family protein [Candidatus Gastranaerophilaceae bacterium]|nr:TonB family protein [Candidatus Gastranaerophilaceae bacterium]
MSILGKYKDDIEEQELANTRGFTLPAVVREDRESMSMEKAFVLSIVVHIGTVLVVWLLSLVLLWLGIIVPLAKRPKPKLNDIEFVLVEKEDTPIDKNTRYRAHINSRAGGQHNPNQRVSMPSPAPSMPKKSPSPAPAAPAKKPTQAQQQPKQSPKTQKTPSLIERLTKPAPKPTTETPAPKAPQPAKPNPPTARPSVKPPLTPRATTKPSSPFQVPVPSGGSKSGSYATGPVRGSGTAANGGSKTGSSSTGSGTGKFAPAPSLSPTGRGNGTGSGTGTKLGGGGTGGGNPGPGNPNGRPGIDAIREPDFGPYMRDLQRRIKMNWNPPKGNESKRVVLLFKIAKDGRLLSCSVYKSSGLPSADQAALAAVKATAPFKPLPVEYKNSSIDIQFTFDYNVFGATKY